jgi:DNA repair exonuclease SbcCD nuclease subunit
MRILFCSDPHLQLGGQFSRPTEGGLSTWANFGLNFFTWLTDFVVKWRIQTVCIAGDIFTQKNNISIPLFNKAHDAFYELAQKVTVYVIPGNHDRYMKATDANTHSIYTLGRGIRNFNVITDPLCVCVLTGGEYEVIGIPAGVEWPRVVFPKPPKGRIRIQMIHENILGASYASGGVAEGGVDPKSVFDYMTRQSIDYCFCGDIHQGQMISKRGLNKELSELYGKMNPVPEGKYIILPGATYRQDFGDEGKDRGVIVMDGTNMQFVPYDHGPNFLTVTDDNFQKVMGPKEYKTVEEKTFIRFRISKPTYRERVDKLMQSDQIFRDHFITEYTDAVEEGELTTTDIHDYRSLIGDYVSTAIEREPHLKKQAPKLIATGLHYFDAALREVQK